MSGEHVIDVGPVNRNLGQGAGNVGIAPAFCYRCTCGVRGLERVAANLGAKARLEALEQARADALVHQRETAGGRR